MVRKKKAKIEQVVMLAEKRNGRIAKRKQYNIHDFISFLLPLPPLQRRPRPNLFQRIFRWDDLEADVWERATHTAWGACYDNILSMTHKDLAGKKK